MKKLLLTLFASLLLTFQPIMAQQSISLKFNRTGEDASSVTATVTDENGAVINGASATVSSSHNFKGTSNAVTNSILCPNVNGNTGPTIELTFSVNGIPADFTFDKIALEIHALNGGSNYQENSDNVVRQWNVNASVNDNAFGVLENIDIAAGIGSSGNVHKAWEITNATVDCNGAATIKLTITKGTTNSGCFFGLSEVLLTTDGIAPTPTPEPEPEPEP